MIGRKRECVFAVIILALCSFMFGCATPYQKMAFSGGYKDTHIKDNTYFVEVVCNSFTSQTTAVEYLHRRAKEVCVENGYCDYKLSQERDGTTDYYMGSYGGGSMNLSNAPKPGRNAYVECIKQCPGNK